MQSEIQPLLANGGSELTHRGDGAASSLRSPALEEAAAAGTPVVDTVWKAAAYGDLPCLRALLAKEPRLAEARDGAGFSPLQWAALNDRVDVVEALLALRVDPDRPDHTGQTALHWAAVRGAVGAAEALLRGGAAPGARDGHGYTVAHVAAQYGQTAFLHRLALRWGIDVDCLDADGRAPLHWAAYKGFADALRLLLVAGADLARGDREACTPLHWAAIRGNGEAVTLLLRARARPAPAAPPGAAPRSGSAATRLSAR